MKICEKCSNKHDGSYASGRFCCQKCSKSFSTFKNRDEINDKISKRLSDRDDHGEWLCSCGAKFETRRKLASHKKKKLSNACDARRKEKKFEEIKGDDTRKRYLIKYNGHRCEVCGLTEWMGKLIPIEIDHIDGHPGHNERKNLRLICPNCHAQQPHYKGANVGKHNETQRQKVMAQYPDYRKRAIEEEKI